VSESGHGERPENRTDEEQTTGEPTAGVLDAGIHEILAAVGEGVLALDPDGAVSLVNAAGAALLQREASALIGVGVHEALHAGAGRHGPDACPVVAHVRAGVPVVAEDEIVGGDGVAVPVEYSVVPVDRTGGAVLALRDLSERQAAERSLRAFGTRRADLVAAAFDAAERQRQQAAESIHDDTIQVMRAIGLRLAHTADELGDATAAEMLHGLRDAVDSAGDRLRRMVFELAPPEIDDGLGPALRAYVGAVGPAVEVEIRDTSAHPLDGERRLLVYRLAQEALANAFAHAEADCVRIELSDEDGDIRLRISDDGVGMSPATLRARRFGHLGLALLRQRAALAGGRLRIETEPGGGTTIELSVPAVQPEEAA
jgi:signal transduction histidine kinase